MKAFTPPPIDEAVAERFKARVERGTPREQLITDMRGEGLHIIECIKLVRRLYDLPTSEAKRIVHFSGAWADLRETHDALHESAFQVLEQDGWAVVDDNIPVSSAPAA